ncbi:MAG: T9SS type A sorting domain-containing protein [Bacteroidia bacterium]|nr:T9SS type A sorting domain-containing protein [Bacteroidia bacterium]
MKYFYPSKDNNCFALWFSLLLLTASVIQIQAADPFVPGAGGTLPTFTEFQPIAGKIGGFQVYSSTRHNNWFGSGTYAEVNMSFPDAATLGVTSITLQCKEGEGAWSNFQYDNKDVTTTGNNFSLTVDRTYTLRLLLSGGAKNGFVSNEQTAIVSTVDTYFNMSSLDESMFLSNIMVPWVGRGLQASFIVKKNSDNSVVEGGLTYQWYRVNPVTFEETSISGATGLTYITTTADIGYRMRVQATGDQTTVGGFYQMMSGSDIVSPNKCFVTNPSLSGFTLNLYQDLVKLDTGDLLLRDKDYLKVPITSVTKSPSSGVFQINASLSLDKYPYSLHNNSNFWRICTEMEIGPMHDLMEGVSLGVTALNQLSQEPPLNLLYDASSKKIRFESASMVNAVSLYNLAGSMIGNWKFAQFQGSVSVGDVASGVYVIRFTTAAGSVAKKVMVTN